MNNLGLYNALGIQIGVDQTIEHGNNVMTWYGWSGSAGIKSVEFVGGVAPAMDKLQADVSAFPEPETYAMLLAGLGLLGIAARRRRRRAA